MNSYSNLIFGKCKRSLIISLVIPLALSAFTHLWNPIGFPSIHFDEDTFYLPRALILLNGGGPQQTPWTWDHPYFGQIFLAAIFKMIGYPTAFLNSGSTNIQSIHVLYMVPRIIMGLLAVLDTFLVYKIADVRYDRRAAFIASILFAVMPFGWIFRRIMLDNLLLPFLLSSILFASYTNINSNRYKKISLILLSGILLGLAIFTKIPAFTMIPLVGFLIYSGVKSYKNFAIWICPVILISLVWPAYAIYSNSFNQWISGVIWQSTGRPHQPLSDSILRVFQIDPILLLLGISGVAYLLLKRNYLLLLWIVPFLGFLQLIGFVSFFHLVLILPAFCIAGGKLLSDIRLIPGKRKILQTIQVFSFASITIFGIVSTTLLLTINTSTSYFEAISFISQSLPEISKSSYINDKVTAIGAIRYFWIPQYILDKNGNDYKGTECCSILPINTTKILFITTYGIMTEKMANNDELGKQFNIIYQNTHSIAVFDRGPQSDYDDSKYPYSSLLENPISGKIEIRSNY